LLLGPLSFVMCWYTDSLEATIQPTQTSPFCWWW